jgi:hypothetical protein
MPEPPKVNLRPELPTVFADLMLCSKRADGNFVISWAQEIPNANLRIEQARIMLTEDHLKRAIEVLCAQTGHYPERRKDVKIDES